MKKLLMPSLAFASICCAVAFAGGSSDKSSDGDARSGSRARPDVAIQENASVHDPSVIYDEESGLYYAFGSHFAVASSPDLVNWTQVSGDGAPGQTLLYGTTDWRSILERSAALAGGNENTWAPSVERYNGKYYMYYSLTAGLGRAESVIGRVEADNVLGPYSNEAIIVESVTSDDPAKPNCIDPEVFHDKEGGLWMVYGSHFGGIHMLELYNSGDEWGLPKPGQGFGKLVWERSTTNVEGPFVFYNADTDYYYLLTSHGDLMADYNIRVARSRNPDGPYLDIEGADVAANGKNAHKLAGNYVLGGSEGVAAIGHGSVVEKDGEFFSVSHSRREEGAGGVTGAHSIWTAKILFTEDGWPVLSPLRYAGDTAADIAGVYDALFFPNVTTKNFVESSEYVFKRDGSITENGRKVGSYEVSGEHITLFFDEGEFKGVIADGWNTYTNFGSATCISAVSADTATTFWAVER